MKSKYIKTQLLCIKKCMLIKWTCSFRSDFFYQIIFNHMLLTRRWSLYGLTTPCRAGGLPQDGSPPFWEPFKLPWHASKYHNTTATGNEFQGAEMSDMIRKKYSDSQNFSNLFYRLNIHAENFLKCRLDNNSLLQLLNAHAYKHNTEFRGFNAIFWSSKLQ